jgi:hypothetical protein
MRTTEQKPVLLLLHPVFFLRRSSTEEQVAQEQVTGEEVAEETVAEKANDAKKGSEGAAE